jgi:aspartokinase/homoserine dehydrogenase 1
MNLRVIALSNSKNDFDEDGIDLKGWQSAIDKGESADQELFIKSKDLNLRNSILWISLQTKVFLKHEHF